MGELYKSLLLCLITSMSSLVKLLPMVQLATVSAFAQFSLAKSTTNLLTIPSLTTDLPNSEFSTQLLISPPSTDLHHQTQVLLDLHFHLVFPLPHDLMTAVILLSLSLSEPSPTEAQAHLLTPTLSVTPSLLLLLSWLC